MRVGVVTGVVMMTLNFVATYSVTSLMSQIESLNSVTLKSVTCQQIFM